MIKDDSGGGGLPADTDLHSLGLPKRTEEPKILDITAINDVGIPSGELKAILEDYPPFLLYIAKFGVGSALVTTDYGRK